MTDDNLPFLPLWVQDFLSSTRDLSDAEFRVFTELMCFQWLKRMLPNDPPRLARLVGRSLQEFEPIWTVIGSRFTTTDSYVFIERLERERRTSLGLREQRRNSSKTANQARWPTSRNASGTIDAQNIRDGLRDGEKPQKTSVSHPISSSSSSSSSLPASAGEPSEGSAEGNSLEDHNGNGKAKDRTVSRPTPKEIREGNRMKIETAIKACPNYSSKEIADKVLAGSGITPMQVENFRTRSY
jgi:uncharacterized protein YdaU (DUF1376 family)